MRPEEIFDWLLGSAIIEEHTGKIPRPQILVPRNRSPVRAIEATIKEEKRRKQTRDLHRHFSCNTHLTWWLSGTAIVLGWHL